MPNMEHIYCVPLLNMQQIVLGYKVDTRGRNLYYLSVQSYLVVI